MGNVTSNEEWEFWDSVLMAAYEEQGKAWDRYYAAEEAFNQANDAIGNA